MKKFLLKLDICGDLNVLKGAGKLLGEYGVDFIVMELLKSDPIEYSLEKLRFLDNLGYYLFDLEYLSEEGEPEYVI